ncbi:MAG: transposase [Candidatus Omnitrophota bacterium]
MSEERKEIKGQTYQEIEENTIRKLSWRMAQRDDKKVARDIYEKREIDGIYNLEDSGLLDGFYEWLQEWKIIETLKKFRPSEIERVMVPFFQFVLLYFLKTLFGIESMNSLPHLLFSNQAAMNLVGFNAYQIEEGVCRRGESRRKHKPKSGPICDDTLARNMIKIPLKIIEQFFNQVVKILARGGFFPKTISVIIDPTDIQTTAEWKGCGKVIRKKRIKDKRGQWKEIEIYVYGWKLIVVFYAPLKIPLAAKLVKIEESEKNYTMELIKKAQENLGSETKIIRVKMDRGHLDGKTLWQMNKEGLEFVIPGRSDMQVTKHARRLAKVIMEEAGGIPNSPGIKKVGGGGYIQVRKNLVRRGIGENQKTEKLRTVVIGIKGVVSYDQYGADGFSKDRYKKSFQPHKINAVVVVEWEGKNYGRDKWVVYLTNMRVYKPIKVFDEYDERSIIENSLFKEAKQGWFIKHAPQKTEKALHIHTFFTLAVFALTNAYRRWSEEREKEESQDFLLGIRRWREKVNMKSKDKSLVFMGNWYGIFWMAEIMVLLGVKVRDIPPKAGTAKEILARYGIRPP